jgi:hypothetical protein
MRLSPQPHQVKELEHEVEAQHDAVAVLEPTAGQKWRVVLPIWPEVLEQMLLSLEGFAVGVMNVEGCVVGEELDVCKRVEAAIVMVVLVR